MALVVGITQASPKDELGISKLVSNTLSRNCIDQNLFPTPCQGIRIEETDEVEDFASLLSLKLEPGMNALHKKTARELPVVLKDSKADSATSAVQSTVVRTNEPVLVYIAHGQHASHMLPQSLTSLAELGEWPGEVAIITDHPVCVKHAVPKSAADLKLHILATTGRHDVMSMKRDKALIFHHLDAAGINASTVLYIDTDIIIGGSMKKFLDMTRSPRYKSQHMLMYMDNGYHNATGESWHGGLMFLRRSPATESCLAQWSQQIASGLWSRDQRALFSTECAHDGSISEVQPDAYMFWFPTLAGLSKGHRAVFMHFARNGCMLAPEKLGGAQLAHEISQYFLSTWGVKDPWHQSDCTDDDPQ